MQRSSDRKSLRMCTECQSNVYRHGGICDWNRIETLLSTHVEICLWLHWGRVEKQTRRDECKIKHKMWTAWQSYKAHSRVFVFFVVVFNKVKSAITSPEVVDSGERLNRVFAIGM